MNAVEWSCGVSCHLLLLSIVYHQFSPMYMFFQVVGVNLSQNNGRILFAVLVFLCDKHKHLAFVWIRGIVCCSVRLIDPCARDMVAYQSPLFLCLFINIFMLFG